eukprot:GHVP01053057.1.p3 GENE.GHVP01053057.1~~GHVP01053057.1.p3  ORF type:complete len:100 (-),score=4.49 GHVP01053057.1:908-1207(-)
MEFPKTTNSKCEEMAKNCNACSHENREELNDLILKTYGIIERLTERTVGNPSVTKTDRPVKKYGRFQISMKKIIIFAVMVLVIMALLVLFFIIRRRQQE